MHNTLRQLSNTEKQHLSQLYQAFQSAAKRQIHCLALFRHWAASTAASSKDTTPRREMMQEHCQAIGLHIQEQEIRTMERVLHQLRDPIVWSSKALKKKSCSFFSQRMFDVLNAFGQLYPEWILSPGPEPKLGIQHKSEPKSGIQHRSNEQLGYRSDAVPRSPALMNDQSRSPSIEPIKLGTRSPISKPKPNESLAMPTTTIDFAASTTSSRPVTWKCLVCFYQQQFASSRNCEMCASPNPGVVRKEEEKMDRNVQACVVNQCFTCAFQNPVTNTVCEMCGTKLTTSALTNPFSRGQQPWAPPLRHLK